MLNQTLESVPVEAAMGNSAGRARAYTQNPLLLKSLSLSVTRGARSMCGSLGDRKKRKKKFL